MPEPDAPCTLDGFRRALVVQDGLAMYRCPFCGGLEVVEA